jgi:hypothetical protein
LKKKPATLNKLLTLKQTVIQERKVWILKKSMLLDIYHSKKAACEGHKKKLPALGFAQTQPKRRSPAVITDWAYGCQV